MAGFTFDAGVLIAAERGALDFRGAWARLSGERSRITVPAAVLAQVWRDPHNARLARVLAACELEPLDGPLARLAGELCGRSRTSDIVDAAVVAGASRRGDAILTSDPSDLLHLSHFVSPRPKILDLTRLRLPGP